MDPPYPPGGGGYYPPPPGGYPLNPMEMPNANPPPPGIGFEGIEPTEPGNLYPAIPTNGVPPDIEPVEPAPAPIGFEGTDTPPPAAEDSEQVDPDNKDGDTDDQQLLSAGRRVQLEFGIDADAESTTGSTTGESVALLGIKYMPQRGYTDEPPDEMATVHPEVEKGEEEDATPNLASIEDPKETLYFKDGKRRIDYVLAYEDLTDEKKEERRKYFEEQLLEEGLELEYEDKKDSQDGKTYYVKIHGPWEVVTRMAELMNVKMPIKEYDAQFKESGMLECCPNPFELAEDLVKSEPDYFTADFSIERQEMFIIEDKETFFTPSQRSMFVHELLLRARYEPAKEKMGVDRLLKQGVYVAAYALHEGSYTSSHSILTHGARNDRHLLYEAWARPRMWYFMQPLDLIRRYFGEKIGMYFCWLGFYTMMLIPASIVGVICFFYGVGTILNDAPSQEICDTSSNTTTGMFAMCPLCDQRCSYWRLSTSCLYSQLTYLFDNYATVFFAGFMAVWSTMFLEFWKRKQAELQYDWDVAGYELEEHMRPEFEIKCTQQRRNPVTQAMEPFLPLYSKIPRKFASCFVVLFMISCVIIAVFGVIMYRCIVVTLLYATGEELIQQNAKLTTSCTAACINLVVIMILNKAYTWLAVFLTDLERPRTDTDYEDSYTFKIFLFQFINYYSSIFYIAFFKGRLPGYPGYKYRIVEYPQEECDPAGCLIELCIQLGIVMIGKQALNNFQEILLPKLMIWFQMRKKKEETEDNVYTRWEHDKNLASAPDMPLFNEYLEMIIQYGFVTIFVAAFPLAPLCALINNVIEIRLDAYKFVAIFRRPIAQRAQDIGIWFPILKGISYLAVLTNAFIIGWTSDFMPKLVYMFTVSPDRTMVGYVNHSLSFFNVSDFTDKSMPDNPNAAEFPDLEYCRYADYRHPPWSEDKYSFTSFYWHVFTARLAFIILFEHVVFALTWLVSYLIPDIPSRVRQLMLREVYIAKEARYTAAFSNVHEDKRDRMERMASEDKEDPPV